MDSIDIIGVFDDSFDILAKCVTGAALDRPSLLRFRPKTASIPALVKDDGLLVVDNVHDARICLLLAEGLLAMSKLVHAPGDQAECGEEPGELTPAKAVVLKKVHGSLRATSQATGYSRQSLWRAIKKAKKEGIGVV